MSPIPRRIQFVCLGNICRSPAAQGVMEALLQKRELVETIQVDSAGTAGYHIGRSPDSRMVAAACKRGINLESKAKQFHREFIQNRDLIVAMDRENYREIMRLTEGNPSHIVLFSQFLGEDWPSDVPDPYYGGDEGFEYVLDMLEAGCPKILESILSNFPQ